MKSRTGYSKWYDESFVLKNLDLIYQQCTFDDFNNGKTWYENAKSFSLDLSKKYNVGEEKSAAIIAALSPQKSWEVNKKISEQFLMSGGSKSLHTKTQHSKAKTILEYNLSSDQIPTILGGLKTINFYKNIYNPECEEALTIDRHHLNICYGEDVKVCTPKQYSFIKNNTTIFAKKIDIIPSRLQAILWVCWKRIKKDFIWPT